MNRLDAPTLAAAVWACWDNPDFIREYRRLTGASLLSRSPIENEIDLQTGFADQEMHEFIQFVVQYVWFPVVVSCYDTTKGGVPK